MLSNVHKLSKNLGAMQILGPRSLPEGNAVNSEFCM